MLSALGFFFGFFVCLRALSVGRLGYPLRLSFVRVIEKASGLAAKEVHSVARRSSFVMIVLFTVRGWYELKCRVIFFDAFLCRVRGVSIHCRQF